MQFVLGLKKKYPVCSQAFCLAYKITKDFLQTVSDDVKNNIATNSPPFNDHSNPLKAKDKALETSLLEVLDALDLDLSSSQKSALKMTNTSSSLECWAWMKYYFELVGDFEPNTDGEIHIEPCSIADIYKVYQRDQLRNNVTNFVQYQCFCEIWLRCFE